jgi:tetratricopeptide (TPR) repeat protein
MSIPGDLDRARQLTFAADEAAAKDLLLSLCPQVEQADRDDFALEVFAQLGEIYLTRGALDGAQECLRRIEECLAVYAAIAAGGKPPAGGEVTMSADAVSHMVCRYARRARFLEAGCAAAHGDHEKAEAALDELIGHRRDANFPDLADEHAYLITCARTWCATALLDDDLHVRSLPLWQDVIEAISGPGDGSQAADHLLVTGGLGYARFCVETGRLSEAEPWLRRAGARAEARGWELGVARTQLERGAARWAARDHLGTERLVAAAYPVIARHLRAHDVSRCWLYFGLTRLGAGALQAADESWEHAERHWRELGKPLHIHRILLQRSWIDILRGRYRAAEDRVAQARECLDSSPRSSWLQRARLDDHLGNVWRAEALADLGFDSAGEPSESWQDAEARYRGGIGVTCAEKDSPRYRAAMTKLQKAADLKVPAALAVDSVRYSIGDADARLRWATCVSAPLLAAAFAVAYEWQNTDLLSELIEYHSARGTFSTQPHPEAAGDWAATVVAPVPAVDFDEPPERPEPPSPPSPAELAEPAEAAVAAAGPAPRDGRSLTRLGPLPPLRMQPDTPPILARYRLLARQRYDREVTSDEAAWSTWP